MLVQIDPALDGQRFGLGATDIRHLIIGTRAQGQSLFPILQWPVSVYVARVLDDDVFEAQEFERDQVELIAWGMLYRSRDEALVVESRFRK